MFNLEQAIANWRARMLAAGLATPVPLDELEAHLREDIAHELESGLEDSQAFSLVVERIGSGPRLEVEFRKADKFSWRTLFQWLGLVGTVLAAALYVIESGAQHTLGWSGENRITGAIVTPTIFQGQWIHYGLPTFALFSIFAIAASANRPNIFVRIALFLRLFRGYITALFALYFLTEAEYEIIRDVLFSGIMASLISFICNLVVFFCSSLILYIGVRLMCGTYPKSKWFTLGNHV